MKVTKAADAHVNIVDVPTPYYNLCDALDKFIITKFVKYNNLPHIVDKIRYI